MDLRWAADWTCLKVLAKCQVLVRPLGHVSALSKHKMFADVRRFSWISDEALSKRAPVRRSDVFSLRF